MFDVVKMAVAPEGGQVIPGGRLTLALTLRNASAIVDRYHVAVTGVPAEWVTLDKTVVSLFPGESERVMVTLAPPAGVATAAGDYPVALTATSEDDPTLTATQAVALTVGAVGQLGMDLLPPDTEGRQGAFRVTFTNGSNRDETVALHARDSEEGLIFMQEPDEPIRVPAGGERVMMVRVRPKTRETIGEPHPYDVEFKGVVEGVDEDDPMAAALAALLVRQGRYTYHPPITALTMPRWLRRLPALLLLLLLLLLMLLMLLATNKPATAAVTAVAHAINPPAKPAKPTVPPTPTRPASPTPAPTATRPAPTPTRRPVVAPTPGPLPRVKRFDARTGSNGALGLGWDVTGATGVSIDGQKVSASGKQALNLNTVTTIVLTARSASGTVTRVLRVAPPPHHTITKNAPATTLALPSIARFTAGVDPATGVFALVWRVTGANNVTLDNRPVGAQGSEELSRSDSSTHVLRAVNSLGVVQSSVIGPQGSSRVAQGRVVAPSPSIDRFVIVHERVGQPYLLVWRTSRAATVTLNGARVGATGSMTLHAPLHSATYRLVASNNGGSATGDVRLVVSSQ